jgi:adenylate cyclase
MKQLLEIVERFGVWMARRGLKRIDIGLAVLVTIFSLGLYSYIVLGGNSSSGFRFIQNIENRSLDARFNLRGTRPHDDNIVIVGLEENTLQKVGAFPIPRNAYAKMVEQLAKGGARIVAFDFNFPVPEKNSAVDALEKLQQQIKGAPPSVIEQIRAIEATSDNDKILGDSIKGAGNVVLGYLFLDPERAKSVDTKLQEDYFNTLWAHPFPWLQKAPGSKDFDFNRAWALNGGSVASGVYANLRILAEPSKSAGFFDDAPDSDGTNRRIPLLIRYADKDFFPSLALETARQAENIKEQSMVGYLAENGLERIEIGPHTLFPAHDGTALINYAGPYKTYKHYNMIDVIDGTVPPETFKDKIVMFGATAVAIGDIRTTPYQSDRVSYMGVEIHANAVDNILHSEERGRGFLSRGFREEMIDLLFILTFGLGLGIWFSKAKPLIATASAIAALAVFGLVVYWAFSSYGMWLSFVLPAGALVANYGVITSYRMVFEEREKRKVRKTFGMYVAPGVINLLETNPRKYLKPGGELRPLTMMFSDIRKFTTISEGLTPDELVSLLNEYFDEMIDILFKRWGTLDKFIGDAIMAFWGSPFPQEDHAIRACAASLEMGKRLEELNMKWEALGKKTLNTGIGLNTGEVNVGNLGSTKRIAWTVMGDPVNLASRLEGATKDYHCKILVGEGTYQLAKDHFVFREIDFLRVVGKQKPVQVFELLDFANQESKYTERLVLWSEGLAAYRRGQWPDAISAFSRLLKKYPDDGPGQVFLDRSQVKQGEGVSGPWDGIWVMTTK